MIHLSHAAIYELNRLKARHPNATGVRLAVKPGGCADLYYSLEFDQEITPTEYAYQYEGIQIAIAPDSLNHLKGTTIDYSEDLMGGGFRFHNPNATRSCDCGNSFAVTQLHEE
ncbi:MAG: iron-sulfur cluster assembly accessory protein [Oculatellaceae cyanobacterium bins.114]|nr:iron-sulfur cluster assembly accessory protein [Oculatellaceae cyanobacterium bins.114]